ncbi:hypothetical protein CEXT_164661, partial [Caerostris extrusa]
MLKPVAMYLSGSE